MTDRPEFYRFHNGEKAALQFPDAEYAARQDKLRALMKDHGVTACVFTSMHNISYYSGFTYCAFGRPYGLCCTNRVLSALPLSPDRLILRAL